MAGDDDASVATSGERTLRICARCKHRRMRARPVLFSGTEMVSADVLKQHLEWVQQERQREEAEQRRYMAGGAFDYEPFNYPWCASYTRVEDVEKARAGDDALLMDLVERGLAVLNTVTGDILPVYVLCDRMNPRAECERYESLLRPDEPTGGV
jgi:hypothetical protein